MYGLVPMTPFSIQCPTAIHFGSGTLPNLPALIGGRVGTIAFLRGASGTASAPAVQALGEIAAPVLQIPVVGEPSITSVNDAFAACEGHDITHVVACGGGSVLDTAKALAICLSRQAALPERFAEIPSDHLAHRTTPQLIALPTTAGTGAEVTSNAVLSVEVDRSKTSLRGRALFPDIALVDPDLLASAPKAVLLHSGLDAVVQTVEAYTSRMATPFSDALTEPNIRRGLTALKRVVEGPTIEDLTQIAWVSLSSGLALANSGLGAAHGLAAVLGAELGAPHGALCGRLIGPVLEQNRARAGEGTQIAIKLDTCLHAISAQFPSRAPNAPLQGFYEWTDTHGLPRLGAFGAIEADLPGLAQRGLKASSTQKNAIPAREDDLLAVLRKAL